MSDASDSPTTSGLLTATATGSANVTLTINAQTLVITGTNFQTGLTVAIDGTVAWLEEHNSEEMSVYDAKQRELEEVANPIIAKAYGAPPSDESNSSDSDDEDTPSVEEMD